MSATGPDAEPFRSINPYSGETLGEFPYLEIEQLDEIIDRAHAGFEQWRELGAGERAAVVSRAADLVRERADDLARTISAEMGKLIGEAHWEIKTSADILRFYADNGPRFLEPEALDIAEGGDARVVYEPLGVLLGIEPWNFPLYQVVRLAAPNLVAGNTILLKHTSTCPLTALKIEQIFADAGTGEGVYTNVFLRTRDVERVIAHPAVQGVALTGSDGAGAAVAEQAGRHIKKCVLELGGNDPFIVLDSPDLESTVDMAVQGRMFNTGQSCVASKRFFVPESIHDRFVEALAARFSDYTPGDPTDPETTLGPLSSEEAADGLADQVRDALDKGARAVVGGGRPPESDRGPGGAGAFFQPTVLTEVTPEMRAFSEELFGPVAVVHRVSDTDEAVRMANDSPYGLGATIVSSDTDAAQKVARRIDSGMVWINAPTLTQADLPFGGVKRSGFGRELSRMGMYEFVNRKLVRTVPS
ncbi:NAD-dependent succinate-semialdehyde dehydrogenase [Tomitella fengzijianii]|uniref:NAD-dependent succinate-semialdehyde dehydrogenase n=1 Tax=Tomitella fengzijianii TaxID=2597660 RepID=A0A516X939_9ACTN|nr:NAD-dependent succinate-semialdehyde dehydrogenase [Tomitella fengzijianii]QDQ99181.1 NAD-dependent succinate-semialdehyde dehydrogenase [Tomitella fengzijianii]